MMSVDCNNTQRNLLTNKTSADVYRRPLDQWCIFYRLNVLVNLAYFLCELWNIYSKGSQMDVFCILVMVYCYLEFKQIYLINLKCFHLEENKYLSQHFCEEGRRLFGLLKSVFLRNGSLNNARWFYPKNY